MTKSGRKYVEQDQRPDKQDELHVASITPFEIFVQRRCIIRNSMDLHDWAGLELRHLIALQAVGGECSFGRAADRLGYTQSAVRRQFPARESRVGQRLVRGGGGPCVVARPVGGA